MFKIVTFEKVKMGKMFWVWLWGLENSSAKFLVNGPWLSSQKTYNMGKKRLAPSQIKVRIQGLKDLLGLEEEKCKVLLKTVGYDVRYAVARTDKLNTNKQS